MDNGGRVLLCHHCQRAVFFAGGMVELLVSDLKRGVVKRYRERAIRSHPQQGDVK